MSRYQDPDSIFEREGRSSKSGPIKSFFAAIKVPLIATFALVIIGGGIFGSRTYIASKLNSNPGGSTLGVSVVPPIPSPSIEEASASATETPTPSSSDDTSVLAASTDTTTISDTPVPSPTPSGPVPDSHTHILSCNPGNCSAPADGSSTVSFIVIVEDSNGKAMSGQNISLTAIGGATLTPGSANTDSNGQATFTAKSNIAGVNSINVLDQSADNGTGITIAGAGSITFNSLGSSSSTSSSSSGNSHCTTADGVPNFWYTDYYPNSPVSASTSTTVSITIRDCKANTVSSANDTITITLNSGDSGNTNFPSTITASGGQASFTVQSQVATSDTFTITDTTNNFSITDTNNKPLTVNFSGASNSSASSSSSTATSSASTSP